MSKINNITKIFRFCYFTFLIVSLIGLILTISLVIYLEANLPDIESLKSVSMQVPLKIYSSDNKLIAEFGDKRRSPVTLDQVPEKLIQALLATEDHRFYQHNGVDLRGLLRAAMTLVTTGQKEQGGSTITMQVARNFFLTRQKTYARKLNEILLAIKIEQELTKAEILSLYLNKIYLGKHAYGIGAAAEVYYGTTVDKLTLAQMAMLAGLPQAPSSINPLNKPDLALKRRQHVLARMLQHGYINEEEFNTTNEVPLSAKYYPREIELEASYLGELIRQKIIDQYGVEKAYSSGISVYTTINSQHQLAANKAVNIGLLEYSERHGYEPEFNQLNSAADLKEIAHPPGLVPAIIINKKQDKLKLNILDKNNQPIEIVLDKPEWHWIFNKATQKKHSNEAINNSLAPKNLVYIRKLPDSDKYKLSQIPKASAALVSMDPNTGAVLSLVGGFDYQTSNFNRATQASRQPGSAFKPFIYTAALLNGYSPASVINDAPITETSTWDEDWRPQNHTLKFYGPTRLRVGLTASRNLVSIRLLRDLGIEKAISLAKTFGFREEQLPHGLSLALGTGLVTPMELTTAYCPFANGGFKIEPYFIKEIKDFHNKTIYEAPTAAEINKTRIISPQTSYQMQSILKDTIQAGTGRRAKILKRPDLAGKSGSTNDLLDAWFAGFNENIVVTTWIGFDEPKSLKEYGSQAALPMWIYFMQDILDILPISERLQPPGIVAVRIDPKTGLLANDSQTDAITEVFTPEQIPTNVAPKLHSKNNNSDNYPDLDNINVPDTQELF